MHVPFLMDRMDKTPIVLNLASLTNKTYIRERLPTENIILQRFERFKAMFVSSTVPNSVLLELIDAYIRADDDCAVQPVEVLDGQLSLF